ncbi:DUF1360 domain-containing protein [Bacillus sp. PS06]|uniref:DUF1360 domain-containing protein n=1 Tax=Bacillus sp. PS06 TaxID=2764176 RepID=UPI00177DD4AF|nr:DUF1360 domain-containing protein [Bacillus sp. PS06]MBD8067493.1 DUF1360 domain-containing protein [Bacillus sp. PS06]
MIISWLDFVMLCFASFRLTRLIVFDKITEFARRPFLREVEEVEADGEIITYIEVKGKGIRAWIGELLACYWCTGMWCAGFIYLLWFFYFELVGPVIMILAIAGVAAIIELIVSRFID